MTAAGPVGPLTGLTVVDATGPMGNYCGKLFADLGAQVILVEPPGGTALRHQPPYRPVSGGRTAQSLAYWYSNTNKQSLVLDLERPADIDVLRTLVLSSDLLLESWVPGELQRLGLAPEALLAQHPRLVVTSISPFGQTGPWADYQASDLICVALGGLLSLTGYPDGPPVQPFGQQSYVMASLYAAVSSMLAITHAELTGEGQWIDVSVHECVTTALETAPQYWDLERVVRGRPEGMHRHAGSGIYPCADGYVYLFVGGVASNRFWGRLVDWLIEEEVVGAAQLNEPRWQELTFLRTDEAKETFAEMFEQLAGSRAKDQLYRSAQQRGIPLCPVNSPADIAHSRQLAARGYLVPMPDDPETLTPGAPYRLQASPWALRHGAPELGADSDRIRARLSSAAAGRLTESTAPVAAVR